MCHQVSWSEETDNFAMRVFSTRAAEQQAVFLHSENVLSVLLALASKYLHKMKKVSPVLPFGVKLLLKTANLLATTRLHQTVCYYKGCTLETHCEYCNNPSQTRSTMCYFRDTYCSCKHSRRNVSTFRM